MIDGHTSQIRFSNSLVEFIVGAMAAYFAAEEALKMLMEFDPAVVVFDSVFLYLLFLIPFGFFACNGMGWLFRFVISGKIHFLPWKK